MRVSVKGFMNVTDEFVIAHQAVFICLVRLIWMVFAPIYIYIYIIFGPVKPELGVIPSGQEGIQA